MTIWIAIILAIALAGVIAFVVQQRRINSLINATAQLALDNQAKAGEVSDLAASLSQAQTTLRIQTRNSSDRRKRLEDEIAALQDQVERAQRLLAEVGDPASVGGLVKRLLQGDGPDSDS